MSDRAVRALTDVVAAEEVAPLYQRQSWLSIQLNKGLQQSEIAEICDVSRATITKWVGRFGMESRDYENDEPYHDPEWLKEKYHDEGFTQKEIAEMFGVNKTTISTHMKRNGIDTNEGYEWCENGGASYYMDVNGYMRWESSHNGETDYVAAHRLLAVAEFGYEEVVGNDVHHNNNIPWDNRPANIEVLTHAEHTALHNEVSNNE